MNFLSTFLPVLLAFLFLPVHGFSQRIMSPETFLGYPLGSRFTFHHKVLDYYDYLAGISSNVKIVPYGMTYEGRSLEIAILSSEKNMEQLDALRKANLKLTNLHEVQSEVEAIPIVWLSYNVHGNEAVSTEAAMETLYLLATNQPDSSKAWLDDLIIILDPCINPDGRDRYVNWYTQYQHTIVNPRLEALEHREPWPRGRVNHYLFDLNRDWAWMTQIETQQRMVLFKEWMPHVHVDFHEMGINSPYYFAPAAKPYHEVITDWQVEFQTHVGKNNAKYFDQEGWAYFTRQVFDLLYPSYGDTWPTYNGAIGFTYEQGGSGRAGVAVYKDGGDTLTLRDRIDHHITTGLSTIETSYRYKDELISNFSSYFEPDVNALPYRGYILKTANHTDKRTSIMEFLDSQQITYDIASAERIGLTGYEYSLKSNESFTLDIGDLYISGVQPQSRLVQVFLEPETYLEDSITYDLTAWSLPYIYGVNAYALSTDIEVEAMDEAPAAPQTKWPASPAYAYVSPWKSFQDAQFLAAVLQKGIKVRYAEQEFSIEDHSFDRASLVILQSDNRSIPFEEMLQQVADSMEQKLIPVSTGFVSKGVDLGSDLVKLIGKANIAILVGESVSAYGVGELWHYFEQQLHYPVSLIDLSYLSRVELNTFDIILLPSGNYAQHKDILLDFANKGGRVIAIEGAIRTFSSSKENEFSTLLSSAHNDKQAEESEETQEEEEYHMKRYESSEREALIYSVAGSIYKLTLDDSHPFAFGLGPSAYVIKRNRSVLPYLPEGGWNVGIFDKDAWIAGFTGYKLKEDLKESLGLGIEYSGAGQIVYFSDSPIFRGFWYQGKVLLANTIFFDQPFERLYGE